MKKFPFDVTSCQKDIQKTLCLIYQNIDYAGLKLAHAEDMDLVDEFVEGKPCFELYEHVCDANKRICERLGVQEDKDVEIIINCMDDIGRILAMKMYDYGMKREELCQP